MAANVAVAQDPAGNLKPAKDKSTERIDGIVAPIMAIGRAMSLRKSHSPPIRSSRFEALDPRSARSITSRNTLGADSISLIVRGMPW